MSEQAQWNRGGKQAVLRTYIKLHEGKIGAHWLWCVIERIAAGATEAEAFADYGYTLCEAAPSSEAQGAEAPADQPSEPVFHLRSYGDVSQADLDAIATRAAPPAGHAALPTPTVEELKVWADEMERVTNLASAEGWPVDCARAAIASMRKYIASASALPTAESAQREALTEEQKDAARYRWLRNARGLELRADRSVWLKPEGGRLISSHYLAADGTQYGPGETLDEIVDAAIERAAIDKQGKGE